MPTRLYLLIKAGPGSGAKIAHQAGYALYGNPPRWRKITPEKPAPKGAPVAHHPEAAGVHEPAAHFTSEQWAQLKLPESNVNAPSYNKALDKLREWSEAGNVTAIVGAGFGTNTYGKKLALIANQLLKLHGSVHQVQAGQKSGSHPAVAVVGDKAPKATGTPAEQGAAAYHEGKPASPAHDPAFAAKIEGKPDAAQKMNEWSSGYHDAKQEAEAAEQADAPAAPSSEAAGQADAPKLTEAAIIAAGGKEWISKTGEKRFYFNTLYKWFGLDLEYYNTGNIAHAKLDGSPISNTHAGKIKNSLYQAKVYWSPEDGEFHGKNIDDDKFEKIVAAIKKSASESKPAPAQISPDKLNADLKNQLEMLHDFLEKKPDSPNVPAWKAKIKEIEAKIGPLKQQEPDGSNKVNVDTSGWSESAKAAYALAEEYKSLDKLNNKAVGAFKIKLRALAKKTPESDTKAVFYIDGLSIKLWGTDYDPKVAKIEFAPAADAGSALDGPKEGDTKPAADGGILVLKDGHWVKQGGDEPSQGTPSDELSKIGEAKAAKEAALIAAVEKLGLGVQKSKTKGLLLAGNKGGMAKTYANQTQASNAAQKLLDAGIDASVIGMHPYFVSIDGMLNGVKPSASDGPREGDIKPGANGGTLVLKDGHWVKQGDDEIADLWSAATTEQKAAILAAVSPAYTTGYTGKPNSAAKKLAENGWGDLTESVQKKAAPFVALLGKQKAEAKPAAVMPEKTADLAEPSAGKDHAPLQAIGGITFEAVKSGAIWKAKVAGTDKVLDGLHSDSKGGLWEKLNKHLASVGPDAFASEFGGKTSTALSAQQLQNLQSIPWFNLKLPDSNTNAKSHNAAIDKINAMAFAGDKAGLQAFIDAKAGAKQTYTKKQHLLAQTALAALGDDLPQKPDVSPSMIWGAAVDTVEQAIKNKDIKTLKDQASLSDGMSSEGAQKTHAYALAGLKYLGAEVAAQAATPEPAEPAQAPGVDLSGLSENMKAVIKNHVANKNIASLEAIALYSDHAAYKKAAADAAAALKAQQPVIGADTPLSDTQKEALAKLSIKDLEAIKNSDGLPANVKAYIEKKLNEWKPPTKIKVEGPLFTNTTNGHNKFWSVSVHGKSMQTAYGKIGTMGQSTVKEFASEEAAKAAAVKLMDEKKANGYLYAGTAKHEYDLPVGVAAEQGPKEGDTKMGAEGMLVLKDGHWVKMEQKHPVDTVPMPDLSGLGNPALVQKALEALKEKVKAQGTSALAGSTKVMKSTGKLITYLEHPLKPGYKFKVTAYKHSTYTSSHKAVFDYVEALKASVGKGGKTLPATNAAAPTSKPAPVDVGGPPSVDTWEQTGPQKGSNPGGKFKDPAGQEWYCKFPSDENAAKSEVLAANLYALAGLSSQDAKLIRKNGKIGIASKWVNITKAANADALANVDGALSGFAVDAWLGNWDVVGQTLDNLQIGPDGNAHRVDAGGSLEYRAQGAKKEFGNTVEEIDTLRDPSKNPQAAAVFGKMTKADIAASVAKVTEIDDELIRAMVDMHGPGSDADKQKLADTLIARKADLLSKYPAAKPKKAKALPPVFRIPEPPDFANWNGPGSGLSSKAVFNKQNDDITREMYKLGKAGDLDKLKAMTFQPIDAKGYPVGAPQPLLQHPSQHIKAYFKDVMHGMTTPYVSPKIAMADAVKNVGAAFKAMSALFPTMKSLKEAAVQIGRYALIGKATSTHPLAKWVPQTKSRKQGTINEKQLFDASQKGFASLSSVERQAIRDYTGSSYSDMNNALTQGKGHDKAYNATQGMEKASVVLPAGTVLSRRFSLDKDSSGAQSNALHVANMQKILDAGEGAVLQDFGIISTSCRSEFWSGHIHLKITVGEGVKGLYVATDPSGSGTPAISKHPGESEIMLPPNTRFLVTKIHPKGHKFVDETGTWGGGYSDGHVIEVTVLPNL